MSSINESERLDTLLALAVAFGQPTPDEALEPDEDVSKAEPALRALRLLSALDANDRQALERRAEWHAKLTPEKQEHWIARTLGRARRKHSQLDEHVHPSHIIAALREEPPRIQALILRHLPSQLAAACITALDVPAPDEVAQLHAGNSVAASEKDHRAAQDREADLSGFIQPEIIQLVRETFLAHFTAAAELRNSSPLDFLSGIELRRLMRLVSIRETALACRGIDRVEAVASFLRRFAAEDARAVASHITMLTEVEPQRVAFAEQIVHEALSLEPQPGAMLNLVGMRLLAVALSKQSNAHLDYSAQKLPIEAARALREMVSACCDNYEPAMMRVVAKEIETLAANLHRAKDLRAETSSSHTEHAPPHFAEVAP